MFEYSVDNNGQSFANRCERNPFLKLLRQHQVVVRHFMLNVLSNIVVDQKYNDVVQLVAA